MIDSHCHLDYEGIVEDQAGVLTRARAAGVSGFLNISTRAREWDAIIATAERESDVWASIGIHPHEADDHPDVDTDRLIERARHPKVIAIGESGLDYFYDHSDRAAQRASFRTHIAAARETGLPLVIHMRDAEEEGFAILREEMARGEFPALIHCFTASARFADQMLDLGLSISISGIVTFKKAEDLQAIARRLPAERLLIETDAPFLAPVPHRGRTCEPAYVVDTARFLADLRGESMEALTARTDANFAGLFAKAGLPR